jgi:putative aldouronate transport system substrate-binding protein
MKKTFLVLAALIMSGTLFAGGGNQQGGAPQAALDLGPAGQLPVVNQKLTYTIGASIDTQWGDPNDGEFWANFEKETNVHIDWVVARPGEADEKYSVMMASGDYPDAFIGWGGGNTNILKYGVDQKVYIPLTNLIPDHMPNFLKNAPKIVPNIMEVITAPDGNIYGLPEVGGDPVLNVIPNGFFINKVWLDKLGLNAPTNLDEFANVLRAFKTRDPNGNGQADEIPWTFVFDDWGAYDLTSFFGSFGYPLEPSSYTMVDRGKVIFQATDPNYRAAAQYLAGLYREGLIDREAFTNAELTVTAKTDSTPMTVGVFNSYAVFTKNNIDNYIPLLPLKGPNGDQNMFYSTSLITGRDTMIITNKARNPEVLLRWADQLYRDFQTAYSCAYGLGPDPNKYWNYDATGKMVVNPVIPAKYDRTQQGLPFIPCAMDPDLYIEIQSSYPDHKQKVVLLDLYMPYASLFTSGQLERFPDTVFTTSAEAEELAILQTDIVKYAKNQLARWISNDGNINTEWDGYLRELNNIGLSRYLQMKQQIYDRSKGK